MCKKTVFFVLLLPELFLCSFLSYLSLLFLFLIFLFYCVFWFSLLSFLFLYGFCLSCFLFLHVFLFYFLKKKKFFSSFLLSKNCLPFLFATFTCLPWFPLFGLFQVMPKYIKEQTKHRARTPFASLTIF